MDNCSDFLVSLPDNMSESEMWNRLLIEEERETITKIPAFVYMTLLIVLGVPGNIIVLVVYQTRFRPSTTKCFIMAMSAFDLCSCLVAMPFEIVDLRFDFQLNLPIGCRVMRFLVALFAYGSVLVLIGVAVDRFQRVCRPYSRQMTVGNSKKGIAVIAILATIFSLPNLIFYGRQTVTVRTLTLVDCSIDDVYGQSMLPKLYFFFQGVCWFLAIVSLSIMYGFIIVNIKRANKRRQRLDSSSAASTMAIHTVGMNNMASRLRKKSKQSFSEDDTTAEAASSSKMTTKIKSSNTSLTVSGEKSSSVTSEKLGRSSLGSDGGDASAAGDPTRRNNVFLRLFSRDVNPVSSVQPPVKRKNVFLRLFSRDVNPIDVKNPEDGDAIPTSGNCRESTIPATLDEQEEEEEIPAFSLEIVEERSGLEDGVSIQNLIPDDTNYDKLMENGIDNLQPQEMSSKSPHGKLHISASEGDNLSSSQGLTNYHKLLSESLQGLDTINQNHQDLQGLQTSGCVQRPKSCDHHLSSLSGSQHLTETDYDADADRRNGMPKTGETDEDNIHVNIPRSETSTGKIRSSQGMPENHNRIPDGTENCSTVREDRIEKEIGNAFPNGTIPKDSVHAENASDNEKTALNPVYSSRASESSKDLNKRDSKNPDSGPSLNQGANRTRKESASSQCPPVRRSNSCTQPSQPNSASRPRRSSSFQRHTSVCSNDYNTDLTSSRIAINKRKQTTMKELKTSKLAMMMFHVTLGFVLSYLPHLSIQIAKTLQPEAMADLMCEPSFFGFYHVALRSIYLNHTLNPLIYGYYNKRFRQFCASLLTSPLRFFKRSSSHTQDRSSFSMEQA